MKISEYVHSWQYLAEFVLGWEIFPTKFVEKIEMHFTLNNFPFFRKSCRLWDNVEKSCRAAKGIDDNTPPCALHAETHIKNTEYLYFSHDENCYANAPQCYVMGTLPVLLRNKADMLIWQISKIFYKTRTDHAAFWHTVMCFNKIMFKRYSETSIIFFLFA